MADDYETQNDRWVSYTKPLVTSWVALLSKADDARKRFLKEFDLCEAFYGKSHRFLWEDTYRTELMGPTAPVPRFQVTVNKSFEFVTLFTPMLCWQNPTCRVTSKGSVSTNLTNTLLEWIQSEPELAHYAGLQFEQDRRNEARNMLWEEYLRAAAAEQPDGGLRGHIVLAIQDALLSGRGLLVPRTYGVPETGRTLTMLEYETVRNLRIDPQSKKPNASDAAWIAIEHCDYYWEVEKRFHLKPGCLKGKGLESSSTAEAMRNRPDRRYGEGAKDLIVWHEIWTHCGAGAKFTKAGLSEDSPRGDNWGEHFAQDLEEVCGDYCYLCVSDSCNYLLNLPNHLLDEGIDDDGVRERLSWPVEYWRDNKWPIAMLDFYAVACEPWPKAPLAPCIGEMICLQILLSIYLDNAYINGQQLIGVVGSMAEAVEKKLKSGENPAVLHLSEDFHKKVDEVISYLNHPSQNNDVLAGIAFCVEQIERKTGLSELFYGRNPAGTQERSATESKIKEQKTNIRPDFMAGQVADFVSQAFDLSRVCAYGAVEADDIEPLLGPLGAYLWETLVKADDPDTAIRGLSCRVEASDLRRPNKERDSDYLQSMMGQLLPVLTDLAQLTQNEKPINGFLKAWGRATEIDMAEVLIPPLQSAEAVQKQEATQDAMVEAELRETHAKAAKLEAEAQTVDGGNEAELVKAEGQMQIDAAKAQQSMRIQSAQAAQKMDLERDRSRLKAAIDAGKARAQVQQSGEQHDQTMQHNALKMWQQIQSQQAADSLKEAQAKHAMSQTKA